MSVFETVSVESTALPSHGEALRTRSAQVLAAVREGWPLALIALGGVLTLAWIGLLGWGAVALVLHLV